MRVKLVFKIPYFLRKVKQLTIFNLINLYQKDPFKYSFVLK